MHRLDDKKVPYLLIAGRYIRVSSHDDKPVIISPCSLYRLSSQFRQQPTEKEGLNAA